MQQNNSKVIVLKQNQEAKLVNALYEMMYLNKQLEERKIQLEQHDDFDLNQFYSFFDTFNQKKITRLDFELGCMSLGIKVKKQQINLLFQRFSEDNSFLTYQEFVNVISCSNDPLVRIVTKISNKTMTKFKELIAQILLTEEKIQLVKERLAENSEFSLELAFLFFDKLKVGTITIDEFREVFESYNIQITNQEIESLISIYTKKESRVSYGSFISGMNPIQ
ncbi:unnamed protein product [Paramecium primaurelia]|uniref:EF-hand domain-containing protein n=1 Tax=Paramecium primaurelia TaxID=5886 RepID=A0A8S1LKY2_PARPR|nr:unnamed protein product [Paramecium primaurelia]